MFTLKKPPKKLNDFHLTWHQKVDFSLKEAIKETFVQFSAVDVCFVHSVIDGTWLNAVVYTYSSDKRKTRLKTCLTPPRLKLKNGPE